VRDETSAKIIDPLDRFNAVVLDLMLGTGIAGYSASMLNALLIDSVQVMLGLSAVFEWLL